MKPPPFAYHRPEQVGEALDALATLDDARLLAGGQSLMPMLNFRVASPSNIIDINRIPELAGISEDGGRVAVGAMTRQRAVAGSSLMRDRCPLLLEALEQVGHIQTRGRGTVGGSLCHLDPAAEMPAVFLALDAQLTVRRGGGARTVAIANWSKGFLTTDLEDDELLTEITFAPWSAGHGYAFIEFARRHGDFALAGVAVLMEMAANGAIARAAISLCGVAEGPIRLDSAEAMLGGEQPGDDLFRAAAEEARDVPGLDDVHAPASYRRQIATVLTRRALTRAAGRAGSGT